jgi:hypothetical protein
VPYRKELPVGTAVAPDQRLDGTDKNGSAPLHASRISP